MGSYLASLISHRSRPKEQIPSRLPAFLFEAGREIEGALADQNPLAMLPTQRESPQYGRQLAGPLSRDQGPDQT